MPPENDMIAAVHMIPRCSHERERVDDRCERPLAHARGYAAGYVLAGVRP